jgi:hypothetical protein
MVIRGQSQPCELVAVTAGHCLICKNCILLFLIASNSIKGICFQIPLKNTQGLFDLIINAKYVLSKNVNFKQQLAS